MYKLIGLTKDGFEVSFDKNENHYRVIIDLVSSMGFYLKDLEKDNNDIDILIGAKSHNMYQAMETHLEETGVKTFNKVGKEAIKVIQEHRNKPRILEFQPKEEKVKL